MALYGVLALEDATDLLWSFSAWWWRSTA